MSSPGIPGTDQPAPRSGFEIEPGPMGQLTVKIWGDLGLGWFGRLSTALSRRGLSIQTAQATRHEDDHWRGTLQLLAVGGNPADPHGLDYVALSRESGPAQARDPRLERHRVERTVSGSLEVRLAAVDELGLLAGLLDRFQYLGLFPERLRVATNGHVVDDTLWLRGVAGNPPSPQAEEALRELMARLTQPVHTANG